MSGKLQSCVYQRNVKNLLQIVEDLHDYVIMTCTSRNQSIITFSDMAKVTDFWK